MTLLIDVPLLDCRWAQDNDKRGIFSTTSSSGHYYSCQMAVNDCSRRLIAIVWMHFTDGGGFDDWFRNR